MGAPSDGELGSENGRFEILNEVGRGAHSAVYRAYDRETRTVVALKALLGWDPQAIWQLKREFRILRSIRHPSLVEIYELFSSSNGNTFYSMELVEGGPLVGAGLPGDGRQPSASARPLDSQEAHKFLLPARDLAEALVHVHQAGFVHRDVKPSNVLKRAGGGIALLDFGLAVHAPGEDADRFGERGPAGTWIYMAPEAILGRTVTAAADWYSVAVLLFEGLTGLPAFAGTAAEVWQAKLRPHAAARRALAGRVPQALLDVIVASLDPDPACRPDGAAWLEGFAAGGLTGGERPSTVAPAGSSAVSSSLFIGRESELAQLFSLYRRSVHGRASVVVVSGPVGIGKSALVRQFLRELAATEPVLVLRGRCHWQESVPFNAVDGIVDELSLWLKSADTPLLSSLDPTQRDCLARVFPVLAAPGGEPGAELPVSRHPREVRREAFHAMRTVLRRIVEERPLVLWIDDAQWADADSAALLAALFEAPTAVPALVILCQRTERPDEPLPVLQSDQEWSWTGLVERLALGPLPSEAARELAARCYGQAPEASRIAAQVADEAAGSPLLISQLAQHCATSVRSGGDSALPSLPSLIEARVAALPAATRRLLDLAAVAMRPIERTLLLRVSGLGEQGRYLLASMEAALLLLTTRVGERVFVEPHHQRIGDELRARLSASDLERCHVLLAENLAMERVVEEERVFFHWRSAGRLAEAAEWAIRAADRSARHLAFEKAAELYGEALALGVAANGQQRLRVERKRAEMLVNAGRGAQAAPVFLRLAREGVDATEAHELRRRAAEEFLMSGHLSEGFAALRSVLADVGAAFPRSPASALFRALVRTVPLWLAERRARKHIARDPNPRAQALCDACHAAAKGLSFVDPARGLYFSMHALRWALASGDPQRLGRSLCFVGSNLLPIAGFYGRWARRMIERGGAIARLTDTPYLEAAASLAIAQTRMMECRWGEMLALCQRARELFRKQCRGATWEVSVATMAALRALEELGELPELFRESREMEEEGKRTGNRYAEVTGLLNEGLCLLAFGDTYQGRQRAEAGARRWVTPDFHVQPFYAARLTTLCDLYDGDWASAARRFETTWREMQRSGLLRHAIFRVDALILGARVGLAVMEHRGGQRQMAARFVRALEREGRADALGWSFLFRAALLASTGNRERALESLATAQQRFESAGMKLGVALAGFWAAQAGAAGRTRLAAEAARAFAASGIAVPERFATAMVPGFPR